MIELSVTAFNVEVSRNATAREIGTALAQFEPDVAGFSEAPAGEWTAEAAAPLEMSHVVVGRYTTAGHTDKYKSIAAKTALSDYEEVLMADIYHTATRAKATIDGVELTIYSVHFPFGWRDQAHIDETTAKIRTFVDYLAERRDDEIAIVMGDFNFLLSTDSYRSQYHEMFRDIGMDAAWRDLGIDVTRRSSSFDHGPGDDGVGRVIDHIMYPTDKITAVDGDIIEIEKRLSDHKPVWAKLRVNAS